MPETKFAMEYLFKSMIPLSIVLFLFAIGSQVENIQTVRRIHYDIHYTCGPKEDVVCKLKKNIFQLGEYRSEPLLNRAEIDDVFQEYSLQDNCAKPQDCDEVKCCGNWRSGVYKIYQYGVGDGYYVYCDLHGDQHGWTVIQRRQDGSVDFYRNWTDYENGFGQLNGEFWLGLSKIHDLVSQRTYQLQVKMRNFTGGSAYAKYDWFFVSGPADQYRLQIGRYTGTAGDFLTYNNGMKFSTKDQDNGILSASHCAVLSKGAWWYDSCLFNNLNGVYCGATAKDTYERSCMTLFEWNDIKPLQYTEMLIRPVSSHSACRSRE